jgi:hypothetical protein
MSEEAIAIFHELVTLAQIALGLTAIGLVGLWCKHRRTMPSLDDWRRDD